MAEARAGDRNVAGRPEPVLTPEQCAYIQRGYDNGGWLRPGITRPMTFDPDPPTETWALPDDEEC